MGPDRYAASVNAGTIDDHEAGFRRLAEAGVRTAIVSTPDPADVGTIQVMGELVSRFRA